jgi:hypothetical protein
MEIPPEKEEEDPKRRRRVKKKADTWWRLPATHFRLLCSVEEYGEVQYRSYYPEGYIYYYGDGIYDETGIVRDPIDTSSATVGMNPGKNRLMLTVERDLKAAFYDSETNQNGEVKVVQLRSDKANLVIDWVFRIPEGAIPLKMYFRRCAAAKIPVKKAEEKEGEKKKDKDKKSPYDPIPLKDPKFAKYALKTSFR